MIGFDVGTSDLVCCKLDPLGNYVYNIEKNVFSILSLKNRFLFNSLKDKVPLVEKSDIAYILGEKSLDIASSIAIPVKRPVLGHLNREIPESFEILSIMIHNLIENIDIDNEVLCYTIPSNNDDYKESLKMIFKSYESSNGFRIFPMPVNKAFATLCSEQDDFTGLGINFGTYFISICFSFLKNIIFSYSLPDCGEWLDKSVAKLTEESPIFINKEKENVNLLKVNTQLEKTIRDHYLEIIKETIKIVKKGFEIYKTDCKEINVVLSGGMPTGLETLFENHLGKLPIKVNNIVKPKDPLYCVARGCLKIARK